MADLTSSIGKTRPSDQVAYYGIVFVADSPGESVDLLLRAPAIAPPQFASSGLESSFLVTCLQVLSGGMPIRDVDGTGVRRVGSTRGRGATAIHLFACSLELRDLLCAVTER